jgi:site-specific DNA recombinase
MRKSSTPAPPVDPARTQAVIYARVSSKEQEKEGFSIPAQLKLLKDYAASKGFTVAQEYVDVETAKQTGRTAFGEMVLYLKAHPSVRVMLVEKTDRLYRNLKDWVTEPRAVSRRKRSCRCLCSATLERNWSLSRKGMRIHV